MRRLALWTLAAALLAAVCVAIPRSAQAQGIEGLLDCEYPDAEYYQAGVFPRYEAPGQRVVLVSFYTGADVSVLDTGVEVERFYGLGWSEDCRYVAVSMGSRDSLDTVVYDVAEARRVGVVPDAHRQPHAITWGPEAYLVVETRNGGILWDVAANTQTLLTTSWNTTTIRNFSRLRWDAANGQLIANLAVGGRVVFDLATGQEIPVAANVTADPPSYRGAPSDYVLIGGRQYPCFAGSPTGIYLYYDSANRAVSVNLYGHPGEAIQMLEAGIDAGTFQGRGWSASCRYVAAAVGIPGQDVSDTVVWDVVEGRRVGSFPDARYIPHPIDWSRTTDALVITTREGATLWYLPTDLRVPLTTTTQTALAGRSAIRGYSDLQWNSQTGQLLIVPFEASDEVRAYDPTTGILLGTSAAQDGRVPAALLPPAVSSPARIPPATADAQVLLPVTPVQGISGTRQYGYDQTAYSDWRNARSQAPSCGGLLESYGYEGDRLQAVIRTQVGPITQTLGVGKVRGRTIAWSPDCRYVGLEVSWSSMTPEAYDGYPLDDTPAYRGSDTLVFLDLTTGERVQEFSHPYRAQSPADVWWSPGGDRALVRTTTGFYLWHPASNTVALLTFRTANSDISSYPGVYWDYERGQILVTGWDAAYAFDMLTGAERYAFTNRPIDKWDSSCGYWRDGCYFTVADDHATLFVGGFSANAMGVWNLDTLEHTYLDIENTGGTYLGRRVALSPDGRYVAMAFNVVRVWDLTAAPDSSGVIPVTYRFNASQARLGDSSVRFVDNTTIETVSYYGNVQRWDVLSGAEIPVE